MNKFTLVHLWIINYDSFKWTFAILKRSVAVAVAWVLPQMSEGPNAKNSNQHYQCNFGTSKITNIHATWHDPTKQCMILNKRQSTHIDF